MQFGRGDIAGQRTAQRLIQMVDAVDVKAHLLHRVVQLGCRQITALALGDQILHAGAAFALLVRLGLLQEVDVVDYGRERGLDVVRDVGYELGL